MKYKETAFERNGKIVYRFDYGGGSSEEVDNPEAADKIRIYNREKDAQLKAEEEARALDARDTSAGRQMQTLRGLDWKPDPERHMRVLEELDKNEYDRSDLKPCIKALASGSALPETVEKSETAVDSKKADDEPSTRVEITKKIATTCWRDLLETQFYASGLHFTKDAAELTMFPNIYYSQGGRKLRDAYKDPARRKEVVDEIMAEQVASYSIISQMAGMMVATVRDQQIVENFNNSQSQLKSALDIKMRADRMLLNVLEGHARIQGAVGGSVYFNKPKQVNLQVNNNTPQETKREEIKQQPRLEEKDVPRADQEER